MKALVIILVLLAAAFFQSWLPPVGFLGMAKPPLVLAGVVYYSLSREWVAVLGTALFGGIVQDGLDFTPLGCSAVCFSMAGIAIKQTREFLFKDSLLTATAITAVGSALMTLLMRLFLVFGDFEQAPMPGGATWTVWLKAGGSAVLALLFTAPVFGIARFLDSKIAEGGAA